MLLFLKNLLFTILIPGSVAVYVPLWIAPEDPAPHAAFRYGALLPFVVGGGIYLWCVWDFATFGRGTPAPIDMPKKLVVRGLYNIVRNPMYVGVLTFILGWALYFASWTLLGYAAAMWIMFQSFITLHEEPTLRRLFGEEFERYTANVGRWLPRRRRRGCSLTFAGYSNSRRSIRWRPPGSSTMVTSSRDSK